MENIIFQNLKVLLPYMSMAFIFVFIITPMVGWVAKYIKAIDLPNNLRLRSDRTKEQRIHKEPKPRMGGVGVIIIFITMVVIFVEMSAPIKGIMIGVVILLIGGILDDKYELSPKTQLLFQLLAAVVAVIAGVTITEISIFSNMDGISFVAFESQPIQILDLIYTFRFPADLITIFWILLIINAMNWMSGIDALGESISIVAAITIGLIGAKLGQPEIALISFILAGSILGFLPYNFPPSKMLGGTAGETNYGYLLATLSILSGAKLSVGILLMIIPIADLVFVLLSRIVKYKVINPFKLLSISGRIHLHHRLMDMGLSDKMTLYVEIIFFLLFATLAFISADFRLDFVVVFVIIVVVLAIFLLTSIISRRIQKAREEKLKEKKAEIIEDLSPEEKYKY